MEFNLIASLWAMLFVCIVYLWDRIPISLSNTQVRLVQTLFVIAVIAPLALTWSIAPVIGVMVGFIIYLVIFVILAVLATAIMFLSIMFDWDEVAFFSKVFEAIGKIFPKLEPSDELMNQAIYWGMMISFLVGGAFLTPVVG